MFKYIFILLTGTSLMLQSEDAQSPWQDRDTVKGFSIYNGELDTTQGFGAYLDFCLKPNTRNFDNGGGAHHYNSEFLKRYHAVTNVVYDPFKRSEEENRFALTEVSKHNFHTATSNSVLNCIETKESRLDHIALCCQALQESGIAYFKVYPGNGSLIESSATGIYQSNQPAASYQSEVEEVFGKGNVVTDTKKDLIIAYKNSDCSYRKSIALIE